MRLTEKHQIHKKHKLYSICDELCFNSKNLYNAALYEFRQSYINKNRKELTWIDINNLFVQKQQVDYKRLHSKVANAVLKKLGNNITSFKGLLKAKKEGKIKNKVRLPKYLHKTQGRFVVEFNNQTIDKNRDKDGYLVICPRTLKLTIPTRREDVKQVRIVPQLNYYVIEVVYEAQEEEMRTGVVVGAIDLGLNNIATIVTNDKKNPLILSGRKLKSINQYFNKNVADRQEKLPKEVYTSKEIERLWTKRRNKIDYETHKISKYIVELMDEREVSKLIIGNNGGWKQEINLGKRNNQNFVYIPYKKIIDQIIYKCQMKGIEVIVREESYTSKASFLDYDYIPTINEDDEVKDFSGKRVKRGLYRTNKGKRINADVNGAYNIMAKESLDYIKTKREELSFSPKLVRL